jgi:hypothetical protein
VAAAITAAALCWPCLPSTAQAVPGGHTAARDAAGALQHDFTAAAAEYHVPAGVLMAVAYHQSLWDEHGGRPSTTGNYNVMGLTHVDTATLRTVQGARGTGRPGEGDERGEGGRPAARTPRDGATPAPTGSPSTTASGGATRSPAATSPSSGATRSPAAASPSAGAASAPAAATAHAGSAATAPSGGGDTAAYRTLDAAAALTGVSPAKLRTDPAQSVRGGAALLAHYEQRLAHALPADPGAWYGAVARFSQSTDTQGASQYADRVYATVGSGAARTTDAGQSVVLAAESGVVPRTSAVRDLGLASAATEARSETPPGPGGAAPEATPAPECPSRLTCNFVPAAYARNSATDKSKYGNYDMADRPADGDRVRYIVIHDTEGSYSGSLATFQNPAELASPHYLVRSSDGLVTQLVQTRNVAWHAGNYYLNTHSVGIEHEGFAISGASWYDESLYESSAALVRYLAGRFGVPLDRQHVIGHDDVPAPQVPQLADMHWDPGPYWNWSHYMDLLGAPIGGSGTAGTRGGGSPVVGGVVTIRPPFTAANEPVVTGCRPDPCKAQPTSFVYLRSAPSASAPLIKDAVMSGRQATTGSTQGADVTDKADAGQSFVVAGVRGDWTAIWFGGRKAWFDNPGGAYAVAGRARAGSTQYAITPAGRHAIPVYGRAYPEASAYPAVIADVAKQPAQVVAPLGYTIAAGQSYVADAPVAGDYYYAKNIDRSAPGDRTRVVGGTAYYPIRFNHRLGFVKASDVTAHRAN